MINLEECLDLKTIKTSHSRLYDFLRAYCSDWDGSIGPKQYYRVDLSNPTVKGMLERHAPELLRDTTFLTVLL
jgi:hypothetical protein